MMRPRVYIRTGSGRRVTTHVRRFDDGTWICRAYGETLHDTPGAALNELGEALRGWGSFPEARHRDRE
jgi:hypothetical protein